MPTGCEEGLRTAVEPEGHPDAQTAPSTPATPSPLEVLRSRSYVVLLLFGAIIGVPVAAAAYFFLEGFTELQQYLFGTLPGDLGSKASLPGGRYRCLR